MFSLPITFDRPLYLVLLLLVPLLWWFGMRTLSGLGSWRRRLALLLRTAVILLVVLALSGAQYVRTSDQVTVVYLIDQSLSVPEEQRRKMVEYVRQAISEHRDPDKRDRFAVINFGRDSVVEIPPIDEEVPISTSPESPLDPEHTDLAQAMKMALAVFPHDSAKRIVIVSDGNENLGDAHTQAQALASSGVSIDVVPIRLQSRGEVAVEKITVSSDVRRGQPFDLRIVLNNTAEPDAGRSGDVAGKLRILRRVEQREQVLAEQDVVLPPGKRVFTVREEIDKPDFYTYEARFVPNDPADDALIQNNRASAFTHVKGKGHVLLIVDWAAPNQFTLLAERLKEKENLEVTTLPSNQLFTSLSELQRYDTVVLANCPRSSGDQAQQVTSFSEDQIDILVRNTQQMGSGLVMLGGPTSFGAGGWTNTELEKAMPVDFQIKNPKVVPVGALALLMHASEMAQGNHWQKVVAREAIKTLGHHDYCGLIHWNGTDRWLWSHPQGMIRVGPSRQMMLARLDKMMPGDMPQFDPAMQMAVKSFAAIKDAAVKHMIIISDGDPSPATPATIAALKKLKVKVTTVAVGSHGMLGNKTLEDLSLATGGKYYVVRSAKALPRIYQREVRRIARPLVYEDSNGLNLQVQFPHEMIRGVEQDIPPITGFVLTSLKESPLVEVSLVSPKPTERKNATVLASWNYGLGKAVAFTTDAGSRWTKAWADWDNYDKLFGQIIRWSMRPTGDTGKFSIATDVQNGKGRLIITALDKDDDFLNELAMSGMVVGPDYKPIPVTIEQTAPGRYLAQFDTQAAGSYFVAITPQQGMAPIRTGVNVPYSDEFRDRDSNISLLRTIASLKPAGGDPGVVVEGPDGTAELKDLLTFNPFRHDLPKSRSSQDIWYYLLVAACVVFYADVFNRRVSIRFAWAKPLLDRAGGLLFRREQEPTETQTLSRLQSTKAEVRSAMEDRHAKTRFQPTGEEAAAEEFLQDTEIPASDKQRKPTKEAPLEPEKREESYTERLLKAKKRVWKDEDSN